MHILDGPLSNEVCLAAGAISAGAVGYSLYRLRDSLADRTVPLTGMVAALIFAGQMVNFPLPGTQVSGHLMGGVLAAVVLGPWAGCIALTLVLLVQCALFADGGILALGANVLHMAVIGSIGGYAVYAAVRRPLGNGARGTIAGVVAASWLSVMAAAALFCLEFRLSHPSPQNDFGSLFTLMVTLHSGIGVGEALITGAAIAFVLQRRPDLLYRPQADGGGLVAGVGRTALAGVVVALAVAAFLAPFASSYDDGLEAVAGTHFAERMPAESQSLWLEDYEVPLPIEGWRRSPFWQKAAVSLAGMVGTTAVMGLALAFGRTLTWGAAPAEGHHVE